MIQKYKSEDYYSISPYKLHYQLFKAKSVRATIV